MDSKKKKKKANLCDGELGVMLEIGVVPVFVLQKTLFSFDNVKVLTSFKSYSVLYLKDK